MIPADGPGYGELVAEVADVKCRLMDADRDAALLALDNRNLRALNAEMLAVAQLTIGYLNGVCTCNETSGCTAAMLRAKLSAAVAKAEGQL